MNSPFTAKKPFFLFLALWVIWILLYTLTYLPTLLNTTKINWEYVQFNYLLISSVNFILFCLLAFYVLPRLGMQHKKWFWVVVASLLLTIVFIYFKFRLEMYRFDKLSSNFHLDGSPRKPISNALGLFNYRFRAYFQTTILSNASIIILAFAYQLTLIWNHQEKVRKNLQNQKLRAELSYLKMQVNPHFLFNTLNNINSLAVVERSPRTSDSLVKLSELMRYVLYEKEDSEHRVSLESEINHLNSYLDLEKLRHAGKMPVCFSVEGNPQNKRIVPLLLFPLIENAFKHGIITDPKRPVLIELKVTDQNMDFSIRNYKNDYMKDKVGGIGLQNVRKRLDLLYGDRYTLDVQQITDQFFVNLQLPL